MGDAEDWDERYLSGSGSGQGSVGENAAYKAAYVNGVLRGTGGRSVVDYGCGDGEVASRIECETYLGLDISKAAVDRSRARMPERTFAVWEPGMPAPAGYDIAICLEVLMHVTADEDFAATLDALWSSAEKAVVIQTPLFLRYNYEPGPDMHHRDLLASLGAFSARSLVIDIHPTSTLGGRVRGEVGSFISDFVVLRK